MTRSYALEADEHFASEVERLEIQARILFDIEAPLLATHVPEHVGRILDVGCGDGSYLALLAKRYPSATLFGCDRDRRFVDAASRRCPNATIMHADASTSAMRHILEQTAPDVIVVRFVLQHVPAPEREAIVSGLASHRRRAQRLVLIDVDDSGFTHAPRSAAIDGLRRRRAERQARAGGDRDIGKRLGSMLSAAGFDDVRETTFSISSEHIRWPQLIAMLRPVILAGLGPPPIAPVTTEDRQLLDEAVRWFEAARTGDGHAIAWPIVIASGG